MAGLHLHLHLLPLMVVLLQGMAWLQKLVLVPLLQVLAWLQMLVLVPLLQVLVACQVQPSSVQGPERVRSPLIESAAGAASHRCCCRYR
jgi:hypothetical protein